MTLPCDVARVALSAQLDDEDPGVAPGTLAAHLDACAGCRQWLAGAERLTAAGYPVPEAPDLTAGILEAVAADAAARRPERVWPMALRGATMAIAGVQLALAVPDLLGALGFGPSPPPSHEGRALGAALAGGFLVG